MKINIVYSVVRMAERLLRSKLGWQERFPHYEIDLVYILTRPNLPSGQKAWQCLVPTDSCTQMEWWILRSVQTSLLDICTKPTSCSTVESKLDLHHNQKLFPFAVPTRRLLFPCFSQLLLQLASECLEYSSLILESLGFLVNSHIQH